MVFVSENVTDKELMNCIGIKRWNKNKWLKFGNISCLWLMNWVQSGLGKWWEFTKMRIAIRTTLYSLFNILCQNAKGLLAFFSCPVRKYKLILATVFLYNLFSQRLDHTNVCVLGEKVFYWVFFLMEVEICWSKFAVITLRVKNFICE